MNANELADVIIATKFQVDEDGTMIGVSHQAVDEAVTMLRQQQERILELEGCINDCYKVQKMQADEVYKAQATIDKLLNHCDDPECWDCGKIICPHEDEMHFHHDGCPTCAEMEDYSKELVEGVKVVGVLPEGHPLKYVDKK